MKKSASKTIFLQKNPTYMIIQPTKLFGTFEYMQYGFTRNGLIRKDSEILCILKKKEKKLIQRVNTLKQESQLALKEYFLRPLDRFTIVKWNIGAQGHLLGIYMCRCSLFYKEELWAQNPWVPIALRASKSAGAKGDVPKIYRFVHSVHSKVI